MSEERDEGEDLIEVPLDLSFIPYYWGVLPGEGRFAPSEEEYEAAVWRMVQGAR